MDANPSEETHQTAKDAWLAAREPYGQTEVYRFYGGPIDDEDGPEGLINAWPLDESYVDYVEGTPEAGIINNVAEFPEVNADLLESLNEVGAEENISTGYHAIEFLLWGQDLSADGNGDRSYTDYTDAENADRRSQYLLAAADLLVGHLADLVAAWEPNASDNYRAEFLAQPADDAIQKMLTGMGVLSKSELAGERVFVAYDNQDQEDEHSCFSDNTHRDIITNAQGILNVYTGSYTRVDGSVVSGPSLADLVAELDADLAAEMSVLAQTALATTQTIHVPFDQAIVVADHRPAVLESVNALQDQGDKVAEVASLLGLAINTDLPE
jgi:putative iron-regulated protein